MAYFDAQKTSEGAEYTVPISGETCYYNSRDETVETGSPATFPCYRDDARNNQQYGTSRSTFCNGIPDDNFDDHGDLLQMTATEYFVPKSAIPTGFVTNMDKRYVNSNGFKTRFYQTLHQAEIRYSPGGPLHDNETWAEKNLSDLQDGYSVGEYTDSWTIGNIGATGNDKIADANFPGGFAGKCPPGQTWKQIDDPETGESEWRCTGELSWNPEVFLPEIEASNSDQATVRMFIMPDSVNPKYSASNPNRASLTQTWYEENNEMARIDRIDTVCYAGKNDDNLQKDSRYFSKQVSIPEGGVENPVPITGVVDMTGFETYTCEWFYTLNITDPETLEEAGDHRFLSASDIRDRGFGASVTGGTMYSDPGAASSTIESKTKQWNLGMETSPVNSYFTTN